MRVCPELKVISRYNEFIVGIFAAEQCVSLMWVWPCIAANMWKQKAN